MSEQYSTKWETRFKVECFTLFDGVKRLFSMASVLGGASKSDVRAIEKIARLLNRKDKTIAQQAARIVALEKVMSRLTGNIEAQELILEGNLSAESAKCMRVVLRVLLYVRDGEAE